ncbi:MAG: hypothetical protein J6T10_22045 [Methanobrevibacter sp.]|nr:hypothetical protein [Methanobrevibacter sp.]
MSEFLSLTCVIFAFILAIRIMIGFSLYNICKNRKKVDNDEYNNTFK